KAAYDGGVSAIFSINRVSLPFTENRKRGRNNLRLTVDNLMRFMAVVRYNYYPCIVVNIVCFQAIKPFTRQVKSRRVNMIMGIPRKPPAAFVCYRCYRNIHRRLLERFAFLYRNRQTVAYSRNVIRHKI
ncbi:MAG: hypothetical protein LBF75_02055, partial [Treponema sp.]|nr:hypothetical protein [Treponema sp.]